MEAKLKNKKRNAAPSGGKKHINKLKKSKVESKEVKEPQQSVNYGYYYGGLNE